MDDLAIVIAGGGIGGLTAAVAIARTGRKVKLLERAPEFEPIGYGIQLGPNALHTFARLGLADAVLAHCSMPDAGILSDAMTNQTLVQLPMGGAMRARFGQPYAVIHRSDLHSVLLECCATLPQIELVNNFDVIDHDDQGDHVTVRSQAGEIVHGAALIGADGIWSSIRQRLFPDVDLPFTSRYAAFRCVCPTAAIDPLWTSNVINLRCGIDFHLIHYPLRRGTLFNLVAVVRVPDGIAMDDKAAVISHFGTAFAEACPEARALLPLIDQSRYWAIANLTPLSEWVRGRVALIGDSAHAMVQAMAQGACQAIEDGFVLAKHLASSASVEGALRGYHAERHLRAINTQYRSLFMWELIHATGGWRDLRLDKLARMTSEDVLEQFDWLYSAASGTELGRELDVVGFNAPKRYVQPAGLPDSPAASALHR